MTLDTLSQVRLRHQRRYFSRFYLAPKRERQPIIAVYGLGARFCSLLVDAEPVYPWHMTAQVSEQGLAIAQGVAERHEEALGSGWNFVGGQGFFHWWGLPLDHGPIAMAVLEIARAIEGQWTADHLAGGLKDPLAEWAERA